jgi:hypothetical protein
MEQILIRIFLILALLLGGPSSSFAATTVLGPNTSSYGTDDGDGDGNLNVRNVFLASSAVLSAAPGSTQVRLTLLPGTLNPASAAALTSMWVGRGAGTGSTNYDGNQVQLLFGGSGTPSFTASATGTASITASVLTVASGSNWAVGQIVTGTNVTTGTTITSLGTGTGGAGTYNVDRASTAVSTTMKGVLPVVSDWATFGGGQTFDNTKDLVAAWHFLISTTMSQSSQTFVGVNLFFDNGGADSAGTTTVSLPNNITSAINLIIKIEMQTGSGPVAVTRRTLTGVGN